MKIRSVLVSVLILVPAIVWAQFDDLIARADATYQAENPTASLEALDGALAAAATDAERAETYWRISRATLMEGDQTNDAGADEDELLAIFTLGQDFADRAIAADPRNPAGYYWKSANLGRWGETRGVVNSLFLADDMRDILVEAITIDPEYSDAYYVLGILYASVPGAISFGDTEYAVSLARRSIDLLEEEVAAGERDLVDAYYIELASHLIDRGWNTRRRTRELSRIASRYQSAADPLELGFYYEGVARIPNLDDETEARRLLEETIARIDAKRDLLPGDVRRRAEAQELLAAL